MKAVKLVYLYEKGRTLKTLKSTPERQKKLLAISLVSLAVTCAYIYP